MLFVWQIAKFLPSIQSLVTTTMNSHTSVDSQAARETSSTLETHSPGTSRQRAADNKASDQLNHLYYIH